MVVARWTSITRSTTRRSVPTSSVGEPTCMPWRRSASKRPSTAYRCCARLIAPASLAGGRCPHVHRRRERLAEQPIGVRRGHFLDDGKWHAFELCDFFRHPRHQRRGGALSGKLATIGPGAVALQEQIVEGHTLYQLAI